MKKKKSNFEKKLLSYSVNAGILLAGAGSMNASVDVTTVNTTIVNNGDYEIDFNGGGTDITISNNEQSPGQPLFNEVGGINAFFLGKVSGNFFLPYALTQNQSIPITPAAGVWGRNPGAEATLTYNSSAGYWTGESNKYLGVKFQIGANTHYGWVFMSINTAADEITIHSYAYETTPNTGISTPLPVELTAFSAIQIENNVKLLWETATEVNNYGFEIEKRKADLSTEAEANGKKSNWEKIGFVEGHGNSSSPKSFQFLDEENLINGKYQYRLKQIDIDGKFEYTDVAEVNIGAPEIFALEQNYPNPFNPTTDIKFSLPENGFVNLTIFNTLGQEVAVLINQHMEAGSYEKEFDATALPSGTYIYKLKAGDSFTSGKKMLVLK